MRGQYLSPHASLGHIRCVNNQQPCDSAQREQERQYPVVLENAGEHRRKDATGSGSEEDEFFQEMCEKRGFDISTMDRLLLHLSFNFIKQRVFDELKGRSPL
jgi:hypothetical protein